MNESHQQTKKLKDTKINFIWNRFDTFDNSTEEKGKAQSEFSN